MGEPAQRLTLRTGPGVRDERGLNFQSMTRLETVEDVARAEGVDIARATAAEGFGRQLQLRTPDGVLVKINEIDTDLIA